MTAPKRQKGRCWKCQVALVVANRHCKSATCDVCDTCMPRGKASHDA